MIKAAKKIDAFKKGPHFSPQTDKHKKPAQETGQVEKELYLHYYITTKCVKIQDW